MRKIYLSNTPPREAFTQWRNAFTLPREVENIPSWEALGRVTSTPVFAPQCSPNFKASAMDGIAVHASSTYQAREDHPQTLVLGKDFVYVDTGDVIQGEWNAVIMIEDVQPLDDQGTKVEIRASVAPWKSVRPMGEDIVAGEMIVPRGHLLTPVDIGALIAGGVTEISVVKKPLVGILPTGTEITSPWEKQTKGSILDSNSFMLQGLCEDLHGIPRRYSPVEDTKESLKQAVLQAVSENDVVIINAGSSAGTEDYTAEIIHELGTLITHGIAVKPGKPTVLGVIHGKPVIGTPGYPVAAYIIFQLFIKPIIQELCGQRPTKPVTITAVLSKRLVSTLQSEEYIPVKLGKVGGQTIATPINRGSGITMSLVHGDGFLRIPHNSEGIHGGTIVEVALLNHHIQIENTLVVTGSHDLTLDLISNNMLADSPFSLSSSHVGSQGGLLALKRGECHIAPIHLLDETSGVYNEDASRSYFPQGEVVLVKGFGRTQGLLVPKGNPKNIKTIADLAGENIQYMNRQSGAGTRVLLDYLLQKAGVSPRDIAGYKREGNTHTAVAAEVFSGGADVGMGVLSAAKALDLDFIPIAEEEYDFLMKKETLESPMGQKFLQVLGDDTLHKELEKLGGYTVAKAGTVFPL